MSFETIEDFWIKQLSSVYHKNIAISTLARLASNEKINITKLATAIMNLNIDYFIEFAKQVPETRLNSIKNIKTIKKTVIKHALKTNETVEHSQNEILDKTTNTKKYNLEF